MTDPNLLIVGIVRWRDFQEARAERRLRIVRVAAKLWRSHNVVVGDDRNLAIDDGKLDCLPNELRSARIFWMHGDSSIAKHCFGPRRSDSDVSAAIRERIPQVPHVALHLFH